MWCLIRVNLRRFQEVSSWKGINWKVYGEDLPQINSYGQLSVRYIQYCANILGTLFFQYKLFLYKLFIELCLRLMCIKYAERCNDNPVLLLYWVAIISDICKKFSKKMSIRLKFSDTHILSTCRRSIEDPSHHQLVGVCALEQSF